MLYSGDVFSRNGQRFKHSYVYGASTNPLKPYTIGGMFNDAVRQNPNRECLVSQHENKRHTLATIDSEVSNYMKRQPFSNIPPRVTFFRII